MGGSLMRFPPGPLSGLGLAQETSGNIYGSQTALKKPGDSHQAGGRMEGRGKNIPVSAQKLLLKG
jgi:hypothetical protein